MSDKKLLTIKLFGILKEFVSQKSDRVINPEVPWLLSVSTLDEFKKLLWCNAQPYLKREIYFTNDRPHWSDKMFPEEEDLNRFLIFFDTKARRTAYLDSITMADLERWSDGRALTVNIAEYSTAVNSKASFKLVEKYLFSDRKVLSPEEEPVIGRFNGMILAHLKYYYVIFFRVHL